MIWKHRTRVAAAALVLAGGAGAIVSCASGERGRGERIADATSGITDPIRALEARAELERMDPAKGRGGEGLERLNPDMPERLKPGTPAYTRAMTPREEAPMPEIGKGEEPGEDIGERRRSQAAKLYSRARMLRQDGQADEAIEALRRAQRADPGSASIQRALGDALLISGDRAGAMTAYRRAVELGDRSPTVLAQVAARASERGDHQRAMALAQAALESSQSDGSPMARSIAGVLLGEALIDAGYLRAGAEVLGEALASFDTESRDLRWRREIIRLHARRPDLWVRAGDAWSAVGADGRAREAYAEAEELREEPSTELIGRRIEAMTRAGNPAGAALLLLEHLQQRVGDPGPLELRWAWVLGRAEGVGNLLGAAIGKLSERPGLTPAIRRNLLGLELEALTTNAALQRLGASGELGDDPALLARVLTRLEAPERRRRASIELLETNPEIANGVAAALARVNGDPAGMLAQGAGRSGGEQLLHAATGIALGRSDFVEHLDGLSPAAISEQSDAWLMMHAQALALTGRWEQARALANELEQRAAEGSRRRLAGTLVVLQQPSRAWVIAQELAEQKDAVVEDLKLASRIGRLLGEAETAARYLERASELDPYDTNLSEQLVMLRGAESPVSDQDKLQEVVRRVATNRPQSALFGLLRATELARNGLVGEAEQLLLRLNRQHPTTEIGHDLLLSIWKTQKIQGRDDALADGIAWLEEQLAESPASSQTALTLAQAYFELAEYQQALGVLERTYARTGSFEVARVIEQLLAGQLEQPQRAREHRLARLEGLDGVDPVIELAGALARRGSEMEPGAVVELLREHLPADIELLPTQKAQLAQVVYAMGEQVGSVDVGASMLDVIEIIEERSDPIGFTLARTKILLLAQRERLDPAEMIAVVESHAADMESQENADALRALPIQSLIGEDRTHEAIALTAAMATHEGKLDADYLVETFRLLGAMGENSDAIRVIDTLESHGLMHEAIVQTTRLLGTPERRIDNLGPDQQRADLAYTAAALAMAFEREDQAGSFYALALSYDPDHAWSNNDYGYMLIERGERMDEAVAMLEKAAELLPNQASVIDSLGWARYKQGVFEDVIDPETGAVVEQGAISLLTRANTLDTSRSNATILLHLGDAFWRAGQGKRAIDAWLSAENMIRSSIRILTTRSADNRSRIQALSEELRTIRYRIQDAESNEEPSVAPLAPGTPGGE